MLEAVGLTECMVPEPKTPLAWERPISSCRLDPLHQPQHTSPITPEIPLRAALGDQNLHMATINLNLAFHN